MALPSGRDVGAVRAPGHQMGKLALPSCWLDRCFLAPEQW